MLVSDSIPSLLNGVSQQPPHLRLLSQVGEQINAHPSEVDGLRRRPPLALIRRLSPEVMSSSVVHSFKDSLGVPYNALINASGVSVYTMDGEEVPVSFPNGVGYLAAATVTPQTYRALTVGDHTFITNSEKVVAKDPTSFLPLRNAEALIVIKQGSYGKRYMVQIGGGLLGVSHNVGWQTPDGNNSSDIQYVGTEYLAQKILETLVATWASFVATGILTFTRIGPVIHVSCIYDFNISVTDDFGHNGMTCFKDRTQSFSSLPNVGVDQFEIEVVGDSTNAFDSYYVRFTKLDPDDTFGVWKECPRRVRQGEPGSAIPGLSYCLSLDLSTMPHELVRQADGTFVFRRAAWKARAVGDNKSAPDPSFVGASIVDLFTYKNRLGFITSGAVVLSQASDLYNHWPTTVVTVLDDAPVDLSVEGLATDLYAAIPFAGKLMLFAGSGRQLSLRSDDILTPRSVALEPEANYDSDTGVRPVAVGASLLFSKSVGKYSHLYEMTVKDDGITLVADNVTQTAQRYIPKGLSTLAGSALKSTVVGLSPDNPTSLYLYKFYRGEGGRGDKVQSAVHRWALPSTGRIIGVSFLDETLVVTWAADGEGTYLGTLSLADGEADPGADYLTLLDRRINETACAVEVVSGVSGANTRIALPYSPSEDTIVAARFGGEGLPGDVPVIVDYGTDGDDRWITVAGDWSAQPFFVGDLYETYVEPSAPYMRRTGANGSSVVVLGGRLTVRYMTLSYANAGPFTVEVEPYAAAKNPRKYTYKFSGRVAGQTVVGAVPLVESGVFKFPVQAENTSARMTLRCKTHLPVTFMAAEWEGFYTNRDNTQ